MRTRNIDLTYSMVMKIPFYDGRLKALMQYGKVGKETFGSKRYLNQMLYQKFPEWKEVRREVIIRDNGFDLGDPNYLINGPIYVHHIIPITVEDLLTCSKKVLSMENLISCSRKTHNAIHYMNESILEPCLRIYERKENDTCPWR